MRWVAFLIAASRLGCAGDLDVIRETQKKLISLRGKNPDTRNAVPELTVLKHQLRDWAGSRIARSGPFPQVEALAATLDAEFRLQTEVVPKPGDDQNLLGEVAPFQVSHPRGDTTWLQLVIGVGVTCEYDDSLYLFEWRDGVWNRLYELEQTGSPRHYDRVEVSNPDDAGDRLILTVANTWGCASSWQSLIYNLTRIGSSRATLIDGSDTTYLDDDPGRTALLEKNGLLIEFPGETLDPGVHHRTHVLHFVIEGDKPRRIEPVALTAQDFVDEWLSSKWPEIAEWTNPALEERRKKFDAPNGTWEFESSQRCTVPGNQWQIGVDQNTESGDVNSYYFFVTEQSPFSFRMSYISEEPQPGCTGESPKLSESAPRPTLFPKK